MLKWNWPFELLAVWAWSEQQVGMPEVRAEVDPKLIYTSAASAHFDFSENKFWIKSNLI